MTDDRPVRSQQRFAVTVAALIFGPLFMGAPAIGGLAALILAPGTAALVLALMGLAASGFFAYHMLPAYQYVELDGGILRGRRFWTRQLVEQQMADLKEIVPLQAVAKHAATNLLIDKVMGTSNRGYAIRFSEGPPLYLIRGDMTNIDDFILALRDRWQLSQGGSEV